MNIDNLDLGQTYKEEFIADSRKLFDELNPSYPYNQWMRYNIKNFYAMEGIDYKIEILSHNKRNYMLTDRFSKWIEHQDLNKDKFIRVFTKTISPFGWNIVRNYMVDDYIFDFYLPKFNIAIEYKRRYSTSQEDIGKCACCKVIRIEFKTNVSIQEVIGYIISKIYELKEN